MSKNQIVFKRHNFWNHFYRPVAKFIGKIKHYESRSYLKMEKGQSYIILSNHQTDYDGFLILLSFSRHAYGLVSDSFLSQGLGAKIFKHQFGLIGKKKGAVDLKANMDMIRCVKEGGSLLIFPEGNRTYAEFQFSLTDGFAKFVRFFKKPIVLFNFHGGTGCFPRFGKEGRKGPFYGEIKKILSYDDYKDMTDDELYKEIADNLKVYDSESGCLYKSDKRAECLERMLFVCPKCGKVQTLHSKGNDIVCDNCGLKVEYTEDLHLRSNDKDFTFNKLVDWYNYQIRFVKDFNVNDDIIFEDNNVELYISHRDKKRECIEKGKLILTKDYIKFGNKVININDIEIASPISGTKFNFTTSEDEYLVIGGDDFNPLKYVLMFNKLDTKMKQNHTDIYYSLIERN